MNNRDRLSDLEEILAEIEEQSTDEITADLRKAGIEAASAAAIAWDIRASSYHLRCGVARGDSGLGSRLDCQATQLGLSCRNSKGSYGDGHIDAL